MQDKGNVHTRMYVCVYRKRDHKLNLFKKGKWTHKYTTIQSYIYKFYICVRITDVLYKKLEKTISYSKVLIHIFLYRMSMISLYELRAFSKSTYECLIYLFVHVCM